MTNSIQISFDLSNIKQHEEFRLWLGYEIISFLKIYHISNSLFYGTQTTLTVEYDARMEYLIKNNLQKTVFEVILDILTKAINGIEEVNKEDKNKDEDVLALYYSVILTNVKIKEVRNEKLHNQYTDKLDKIKQDETVDYFNFSEYVLKRPKKSLK